MKKIILYFFLLSPVYLISQNLDLVDLGKSAIFEKAEQLKISKADLQEIELVNHYKGAESGIYHIYYNQRYNGLDIYNAITSVHFDKNGEVVHIAPRMYKNLIKNVNSTESSISDVEAVSFAANYLGVKSPKLQRQAQMSNEIDADVNVFFAPNVSRKSIPCRLVYQPMEDGSLRLAYDISIETLDQEHWMSMRIDASNGALLNMNDWVVSCSFGSHHSHQHHASCLSKNKNIESASMETVGVDGASYNVFPLPFESPLDGQRRIVVNPADTIASPFGWHDDNGDGVVDFTITRGNNVHAFVDRDGNVVPDYDTDGGADLVFDFPFDNSLEPQDYGNASAVNLFYVINMMHDIAYHFGFTEAAGNFQNTNFNGQGRSNDAVLGLAQFNTEVDQNNANFSTPPDGSNGTMRMFEWTAGAANTEYIEILNPASIRGNLVAEPADFGPELTSTPIEGLAIFAEDGTQFSNDACEALENAAELEGNIALIDRGGCLFVEKVLAAQEAGAIAVVVCNNQGAGTIIMGGDEPRINIPSVMISRADCNTIRSFAGNNLELKIQVPPPIEGPDRYCASLDNGIIAHEYAHGISNRLTGGPAAAGCLGNDEQMGEGWSDFFTLVTTVKDGDEGITPRGIGNYVLREDRSGVGIRNFPYSTDMSVNPQTYEDVILSGTAPHPLGEIWAAMLWDLYWAMVNNYGFDSDYTNKSAGNNMAIQLVMEGMAMQACEPGFIDGRDAILAADRALYDGANQCIIWEVFARRGLGVSADQGESSTRRDAKEAFDTPLSCTEDLVIQKEVTSNIFAGDDFEVRLKAYNFRSETVSGIQIQDIIPDGCNYINGSSNVDPSTVNQTILFDSIRLAPGDSIVIRYRLNSNANSSKWIETYDFNDGRQNWSGSTFDGTDVFQYSTNRGVNNSGAWFVPNLSAENDHFIFHNDAHELKGDHPILRFTHQYNTEVGVDGGIIEISTDFGEVWQDIGDQLFRGEYRGVLDYSTFAIVDQRGFWGDSEGFITSYLDLSPFKEFETVFIRFRFGSNEAVGEEGWTIDNVQIIDMLNYNTEATLTAGGDTYRARATRNGTFVEPDGFVSTSQEDKTEDIFSIFPNPVREDINIVGQDFLSGEIHISDMNGKMVFSQTIKNVKQLTIPTNILSTGMYFLKYTDDQKTEVKKFIKQ